MATKVAIPELRDEKLDFWIQAGFNALFIGRHGCGKSSRIFQAFDRAGLRWQYFSAPTLDPWVDFVGVPHEATDENGSYIELILPRKLRDDTLDAIFIDELNRSHPKIQNAVFELVQFRSINGRKFPNLKVIWASINPEEDDYKVEKLDPALKDRFPVWCEVPYEPKLEWFVEHYGERLANGVIAWWNDLLEEEKLIVTPRRLQYVLDMYKANGDVQDVLPPGCNVSKLLSSLSTGPINQKLQEIFDSNDQEAARRFLMVENHYASALRDLQSPQGFNVSPNDWYSFWMPAMPHEKLSNLMAISDVICCFVTDHPDLGKFTEIMEGIVNANQNKPLVRKIQKRLASLATTSLAGKYGRLRNLHAEPAYHSNKKDVNWDQKLAEYAKMPVNKTPDRIKIYSDLVSHLPEVMTTEQTLATIELLGVIADRTWANRLKGMRYFMAVVNHCIKELHRNTNLSWSTMLNKYPSRFELLIPQINAAGLEKKLLCPISSGNESTFATDIGSDAAKTFFSG